LSPSANRSAALEHATIQSTLNLGRQPQGTLMTQNRCVRCGATKPAHDFVSAESSDGTYRLLCSRCFNEETAQFADVRHFEHLSFTPVRLLDADGHDHEFHFHSLLLGEQPSLEAFELAGDDKSAGYRFQILGNPESDPFVLLGQLVQKMRRAWQRST
jgi:hypothetical protein